MRRRSRARIALFRRFTTQTAGTIVFGKIVEGPQSELGREVCMSLGTEDLRQMLACREVIEPAHETSVLLPWHMFGPHKMDCSRNTREPESCSCVMCRPPGTLE